MTYAIAILQQAEEQVVAEAASIEISRPAALSALAALAECWKIAKTKRYLLLAGKERTVNGWFNQLDRGEAGQAGPLDDLVLERISHLLAIYNGLHRLLSDPHADEWVSRPNLSFGGRAPIELLLSGRMDDLIDVRRYVDRAVNQ
jgi:hypothetical protein